jgi:hypothetical protein
MERWTEQQVVALAPDDRSVAAARKLARPGPWSDLGSTDTLVWGKCQGSGSTPYQVSVDLTGPAATCSCPSRKFPCKHGLALLLLWVQGDGAVGHADAAADFADEWASGRRERSGARAARGAGGEAAPVDPVAQAKRREERVALMTAGMDDFARWLGDLVRNGMAAAYDQPYAFWDDAAARLVDAQLAGLADRVRSMASAVAVADDRADHLLTEVGRWWAATRAWRGRDGLDAAELADLRAFVGWPFATDEIRAGDAVEDRWVVLGVHRTDEGRVQEQRTWLHGTTSGETVVVLDFASVGGALGVAKVVGTVLDATVARYPGSGVRRALFVGEPVAAEITSELPGAVAGGPAIDDALAVRASVLARNPWLDRVPIRLSGATVVPGEVGPRTPVVVRSAVVDGHGDGVALPASVSPWALLARTGGHPVEVFGELEDHTFRPLTIAVGDELVAV